MSHGAMNHDGYSGLLCQRDVLCMSFVLETTPWGPILFYKDHMQDSGTLIEDCRFQVVQGRHQWGDAALRN